MPAPATRRTYTRTCRHCGQSYQSIRATRKPGLCGRIECLTAESDQHNAAVRAYDAALAQRRADRLAEPIRPRQPREYAATDWNVLVAFTRGASR